MSLSFDFKECPRVKLKNVNLLFFLVGSFQYAAILYIHDISVFRKSFVWFKAEVVLLGSAVSSEKRSWKNLFMEIIDEVVKISSIELECISLPVFVQLSIQPSLWLHIFSNLFVEAVKVDCLNTSIKSELKVFLLKVKMLFRHCHIMTVFVYPVFNFCHENKFDSFCWQCMKSIILVSYVQGQLSLSSTVEFILEVSWDNFMVECAV